MGRKDSGFEQETGEEKQKYFRYPSQYDSLSPNMLS